MSDLINRVNPIYLRSEDDVKRSARAWRRIRDIFSVYATMYQLPKEVERWYEVGRFDECAVLASSPCLAPYKPPRYIAYVSKSETLVIDSGIMGYRRVYVKILRLLARATVVRTV